MKIYSLVRNIWSSWATSRTAKPSIAAFCRIYQQAGGIAQWSVNTDSNWALSQCSECGILFIAGDDGADCADCIERLG